MSSSDQRPPFTSTCLSRHYSSQCYRHVRAHRRTQCQSAHLFSAVSRHSACSPHSSPPPPPPAPTSPSSTPATITSSPKPTALGRPPPPTPPPGSLPAQPATSPSSNPRPRTRPSSASS